MLKHRLIAAVLTATLTSAGLVASPPTSTAEPAAAPAKKAAVKPLRSAGLKLPARAPGPRWMGAWKTSDGGQIAYRLDPSRPTPRVVRPVRLAGRVDATTGKKSQRRGSVAKTAQAAWIVSEYGPYKKSRPQGAAVELALNHLLQGQAWGLRGKKTQKRLSSSRQRLIVRKYAKVMLKEARSDAGPYQVRIDAPSIDLGQSTRLSATVTSASGKAMRGMDVTFTVDGQSAGSGTTDANGSAAANFDPGKAGYAAVTATVSGLPDSQLRVVRGLPITKKTKERTKKISTARYVAVGGSRDVVSGPVQLGVRGTQSVTLVAERDPSAGEGATLEGRVQLTSTTPGAGDQNARVTLYGPFADPTTAATACTTGNKLAGAATGPLGTDVGEYATPGSVAVPIEGHYVFRVQLDGNALNQPADTCGAPFVAWRSPTLAPSVTLGDGYYVPDPPTDPPTGGSGRTYYPAQGQVRIGNLPQGFEGTAVVTRLTTAPSNPDTTCATPNEQVVVAQIPINSGPGVYLFQDTYPGVGGDVPFYNEKPHPPGQHTLPSPASSTVLRGDYIVRLVGQPSRLTREVTTPCGAVTFVAHE